MRHPDEFIDEDAIRAAVLIADSKTYPSEEHRRLALMITERLEYLHQLIKEMNR